MAFLGEGNHHWKQVRVHLVEYSNAAVGKKNAHCIVCTIG